MNTHSAFPATVKRPGLYAIVDDVIWITRLLEAGVRTLQLRIKDKSEAEVASAVQQAVKLCQHYHARLFINDYWQLAVHYCAYGVHLGQSDLDSADLQAIHKAGLRLGISAYDEPEIQRALAIRPSYIALGHVFPTETKTMSQPAQGLAALKKYVAMLGELPVVAIGGISIERVPAVLACGVGSIAVISAITQAPDWRQATAELLSLTEPENL